MGGRLAVLHHPRSFCPPDLREAVGDGIELLWVLSDAVGEDEAWPRRLLKRLGPVIDIPAGDLDAAARVLAEHQPGGIITFVDDGLVLAAELAARLGLPYHTPAVAATLADKQRQRAVLEAAGVPALASGRCRPI